MTCIKKLKAVFLFCYKPIWKLISYFLNINELWGTGSSQTECNSRINAPYTFKEFL